MHLSKNSVHVSIFHSQQVNVSRKLILLSEQPQNLNAKIHKRDCIFPAKANCVVNT